MSNLGPKPVDPYVRIMGRTKVGPTVREELGPCLDCTYKTNGNGYIQVRGVDGRMTVASRIVLEHKLGRPLGFKKYALHHCDRRGCVNEDHLYEGTAFDNMNDRVERNPTSFPSGAVHPRSRFTATEVWDLRELYRVGVSLPTISRQCKLPKSTVYNVLIRRSYRDVPERPSFQVFE